MNMERRIPSYNHVYFPFWIHNNGCSYVILNCVFVFMYFHVYMMMIIMINRTFIIIIMSWVFLYIVDMLGHVVP